MIGELDVVATQSATDVLSRARPGFLAWALAALIVGTVVAVDPAGLVPTGPLRWTVITADDGRRARSRSCSTRSRFPR